MKNFKKNLLLLIAIFPVIILLSSVFAQKSLASHCTPPFNAGSACGHGGACGDPLLILCADSQMCVANYADCSLTPTLAPTSTPTPTRTPTPIPPTPTPTITPTSTSDPTPIPNSCLNAGGVCIPSYPCAPGYGPSSLSCVSGVCCQIPPTNTPTPAPAANLTWQLVADCTELTPTSAPAKTTTSFCENFTNSAACVGNDCTWQEAPEIVPDGGFCTATIPTATPTPTSAPIVGPTATPTPTPTPAIACTIDSECNNDPTNDCITKYGRFCVNPGKPEAFCRIHDSDLNAPCKIDNQDGTCNFFGNCVLSSVPTPTPTGVAPTGSPTPTPTSIPPGMTSAHFKVALFGIVDNPSRPNRKLNIEIFDPEKDNEKIADLKADIDHDPSVRQFKKNHALDAIPKSGIYNIKVKTDGYLRRLILSVRITKGNQNDVPLATLIPGDINGDNRIDLLDYNLFITCYGTKANLPTCDKTVLKLADFDDNIVIDGIDYNTFIKGLSVKEGD